MKAIYNNSQNSLIAFKGDNEPIQFYKGGQLIDNLSAVPLSIEGNPAQYKSEYKKNLLSLGLEGNTFQQAYEGYNLLSFLDERELKDILYASQNQTQFDTNYYYTGSSANGFLNRVQNKGFDLLDKGFRFVAGNNQYGVSFPVKVFPNTTYYAKAYGENAGIKIGQFDDNWQYISIIDTTRNEQTITTSATTANLLITFLPLDSSNLTFSVFEAMVSTSPITDYEPYVGGIPSPNPQYPQTIQNAENLSVALKGVNMVRFPYYYDSRTIDGITFTINEDRSISAKGTATASAVFTVVYSSASPLPKGKYFIGGIVGGSSSTYRLRLSNPQKAIVDAYNDKFFTVAEDTTFRHLNFSVTAGATVDTTVKPILAKVDEEIPVSYEPYIKPQTVEIPKSATFNEGTKEILLAKLGDVYDDLTIDRLTNKVVYNKRINRVVFDGTEAFIGTYNNFYVDVPLFIADYSQSLCSHFIRGEYPYPSTPYFQANVGTVYFDNTGFDTLEDFTTWVQTQYANGTPLTVEYVLYEPEQYTTNGIGAEFYNIVNLPTQNQTNIITVKGDIDPSKVAVTYAKWGGLNAN